MDSTRPSAWHLTDAPVDLTHVVKQVVSPHQALNRGLEMTGRDW